jgi:hypothetical protein
MGKTADDGNGVNAGLFGSDGIRKTGVAIAIDTPGIAVVQSA